MQERTLVLIKPDAVKRKLIGEIIKRFEEEGLEIIGIKILNATREMAGQHYLESEQQLVGMGNKTIEASGIEKAEAKFGTTDPRIIGGKLREWLIDFLIAGPLIAMVIKGENGIQTVRNIAGFTDPSKAEKGTIRGDFGQDSIAQANIEGRAVSNLIHASASVEEAEVEIKVWFQEDELLKS